ncbi:protein TolR [Trichloromonas acetexigens]|jgi:biopolymer transport protein TolR|uniref:Protein TolR n=1 Tax=Trichloromonas acetexigens TaxID=38815 RepID=A0A550JB90_9BACT|nr:protein TolR [Desulfuromonas acetexigens]TRO80525.1 protein TolR [Desulfuromonas acetexigens]
MDIGPSRGNRGPVSQINVTPFVDVMLVLLIIFMVTAPMMEQGVDVNLPEVAEAPSLTANKEPLVITVQKDGAISIGRTKIEDAVKLTPVLQQILKDKPEDEKDVFLEADRDVPYGKVVPVMAAIKKAGVAKLGMVSQEPR